MGMCKPSGGKIEKSGPFGRNIKDIFDQKPNTRADYYDEDTGELLQQRWYGPDGNAIWDRDWKHSNSHNNHVFPHDHYWIYGKGIDRLEYKGLNNEIMNQNYC